MAQQMYRYPALPAPVYGYGRERRYFPNLSIPSLMPSPADLPPNADAFSQAAAPKAEPIYPGGGDGAGPSGPTVSSAPGMESEPAAGPGYGGVMGALGSLAGLATGGIGLGAFANAIGQSIDLANAPQGFQPDLAEAAISAFSPFGAFGTSINSQITAHENEAALDKTAFDPANPFAPQMTTAPQVSLDTIAAMGANAASNSATNGFAGVEGIGMDDIGNVSPGPNEVTDSEGMNVSTEADDAAPTVDISGLDDGGTLSLSPDDTGDAGAGADSVVCTAARDAGILSRALWATAARYGRQVRATDPEVFAGYQRVFSGLARGVRDGRPMARLVAWALAPAWVREMAYRMGETPRRSWLGAAVMWGGTCMVRMQARQS